MSPGRRLRVAGASLLGILFAAPAFAQSPFPTDREVAAVAVALNGAGCQLGEAPVEKVGGDLFIVDDAECEAGQYDVRLDGQFIITLMAYDGPVDQGAPEADVTARERTLVADALALINCELGEARVEREADDIVEAKDVLCDAGQYDVRLNGAFEIVAIAVDFAAVPPVRVQPLVTQPPPVAQPNFPPLQPAPPIFQPAPPIQATQVQVTVNLNLRLEPSNSAPVLIVIPARTIVPLYRCTLDYQWCEVEYQGRVGWVSATYIVSVQLQRPIVDVGGQLGIAVIEFILGQLSRPGPTQVCFYADFNFAGGGFCATNGKTEAALAANWNDRISSIRFGANVDSVQVCTDNQFGGTCQVFENDVAQLPGNLNDALSSYRIPAQGGQPPPQAGTPRPDEVCFYADTNFAGQAFCAPNGTTNPALGADWNDRISSIRLGQNVPSVQVCSDTQFAGSCRAFPDDVVQLPGNLNDAVSSFRIPAPGPGQPPAPVTPAANEVCFYADFAFAGRSFCAANGTQNAALGADWGDQISSLRLGTNVASVQLCTNDQFAGTCQVFQDDVAQLQGNLNDAVSSFRIPAPGPGGGQPTPVTPAATEVCFYADFDFGGAAFCAPTGTTTAAVPADWNDRISSIQLGTQVPSLQVCTDNAFAGTCDVLDADATQLPGNLNDNISSFRIPAPAAAAAEPPQPPAAQQPPAGQPPAGGEPPAQQPPPAGQQPPAQQPPAAQPTPAPEARLPGGNEVCFYADFDFGGEAYCAVNGVTEPSLGGGWNDRFSSVRIGGGVASVQVCTDNNFAGTCQVLTGNSGQLPGGLNDNISSFRIPAPAPEPAATPVVPPAAAVPPPIAPGIPGGPVGPGGATPPGGGQAPAGGGPPAAETPPPAGETPPPAGGTPPPAGETPPPAADTPPPAGETPPPGGGAVPAP